MKNHFIPDLVRGKMISIFRVVIAVGSLLGPILLNIYGFNHINTIVLMFIIGFISLLPILLITIDQKEVSFAKLKKNDFIKFYQKHPRTFTVAFVDTAVFLPLVTYLVLYLIEFNITIKLATIAMSCFYDSVVLYVPLGILSDRIGPRNMIFYASVLSFLLLLALMFAPKNLFLIYLIIFSLGISLEGIYLSCLNFINRNRTTDRVTINIVFAIFCGLGGVCGLVVIGLLIDSLGFEFFPLFLASFFIIYFVVGIFRIRQRRFVRSNNLGAF